MNTAGAPDGNGASLDDFSAKAGRSPTIVMWFQSFDEPLFYPAQMPAVQSRGAVPMITWEPTTADGGVSLRDIAGGQRDAYLRQAASDAREWGQPFFVRFAHEMNGSWYPWGKGVDGNTPADYIAAWRHVVSIFREEHATNVKWVWSPNTFGYGTARFEEFYPGDEWVDWVGLDGYNFGSTMASGWRGLGDIFGPSSDALSALTSKPQMIAETSSAEEGGSKPDWISSGLEHDLPTRLPNVRAVVWFDRLKEADWRVDSSDSTLSAFRGAADSDALSLDRSSLLSVGAGATPPATTTPPPAHRPPSSVRPPVTTPVRPSPLSSWRPPKASAGRPRLAKPRAAGRGRSVRVSVRLSGGSCPRCTSTLTFKRGSRVIRKRMSRHGLVFSTVVT